MPQPADDSRRIIRAIRPARPAFDREAALARLVPMWPHLLRDESPATRQYIIARLERALRAERQKGRAGHWTYDLNRHQALAELLAFERARPAPARYPV